MPLVRDSLTGLCWAAAGKDPGFTPLSLLELLKRRGRHREEEIRRLNLAESFDRKTAKGEWMKAPDRAMARWAEAVETLEGLEGLEGG